MDEIIRRVRATLPPLVLMTGLLTGSATIAFAHDPGESGDGAGAAGCGGCHSGGTTGTTVEFGDVPASVDAGSVNTFTFTISGGPASNAGLSITASDGTLDVVDADTTIMAGEVVHTNSAMMTAGSKVYTFTWTAPATDATVILTGAGVSGDSDGSDAGDDAAKTTISISVGAGGGTPPTPSSGEQLYIDNCESCHGAGGVGGADGDVLGASAAATADAIINVPEMNSLSVLTTEEIAAITEYLNPTAAPGEGEQLYIDNCESCHGAGGVGGPDGDVVGESASDIAEAILEVPEMNSLSVLTAEEIDAIAAYLNGGACLSGDDDDDDRLVARRSSPSTLDDDEEEDDDDDDSGSCAGINTAATKKAKGAAIAGGALDVLTLAGIGLLWGRRRKK